MKLTDVVLGDVDLAPRGEDRLHNPGVTGDLLLVDYEMPSSCQRLRATSTRRRNTHYNHSYRNTRREMAVTLLKHAHTQSSPRHTIRLDRGGA